MTSSEKNGAYDVARCREVWKRVCPAEDPYPDADAGSAAQDADLSLPGAQADPCCMGTDAVLTVEVLQGFLREELGDAQVYAYLASCLPREMSRTLRAMSEDEKRHARDLAAADLLITGKPYCPRVCVEQPDTCDICALLRLLLSRRGLRRLQLCPCRRRDAQLCLGKLFTAMSADEYRHADMLMNLLGRRMKCL